MCEIPLTIEQQLFAAEHHNLIYKFLNEHLLPEDEFYDVIAFSYLKAVHYYFTKRSLRSYSFSTIGWRVMSHGLINHFKKLQAQKRTAEVISLDTSIYDNGFTLEETLVSPNSIMLQLETRLLLHDLAKQISKQQMEIVRLKYHGYSNQDIAKCQKTTVKHIQELLEDVRKELSKICSE